VCVQTKRNLNEDKSTINLLNSRLVEQGMQFLESLLLYSHDAQAILVPHAYTIGFLILGMRNTYACMGCIPIDIVLTSVLLIQ